MQIAIVFDSGFGHTAELARSVAEGVGRIEGAHAVLAPLADGPISWTMLEASDAVVFGSPTYNGLVSARFKQFMEDTTRPVWLPQTWRNKIAAGFTNSGALHGDKLNSLVSIALFAAQHGMIWVGLDLFPGKTAEEANRIGGWLGAMAQSDDVAPEISPGPGDRATAAHLGYRVAEITRQFLQGAPATSRAASPRS